MKLTFALYSIISLLPDNIISISEIEFHHPQKISYETLLDEDLFHNSGSRDTFLDALTEYGIISVKNIPGYDSYKNMALQSLHQCALESSIAKEHVFSDGTIRRTFASNTIPGRGGQQKINHKKYESNACKKFAESSDLLRNSVAEGILAFSMGLNSILDTATPILSTEDGSYDFEDVMDMIESGEHLEHFHSYERGMYDDSVNINDSTIDLHTDQGLFIVFAPALLVPTSSTEMENVVSSKKDFYIQLQDGSVSFVEFDDDDLVFMLGDGVNQLINPMVKNKDVKLRATPHGLVMSEVNKARVWYGRMVLPPTDAVHPEHKLTFGYLRHRMIEESLSGDSNQKEMLGIGCSGHSVARQMEENVCAEGTTYCWHRCMEHADYNISTDICRERNLQLQCINPREQVYISGHGDFYPACSNSTENATEYPTLPGYSVYMDENKCGIEEWEDFSSTEGYEHMFDRLGDNRGNRGYWEGAESKGGNVTKFMWNVVDDKIQGKLVFNGLFGYLAMGFAHPEGNKNGMNGASIIMAIPGGNYSAKFGLDLGMESSVNEYVIDLYGSSFRHWSDPLPGRDTSTYAVQETECFTALTFETNNINNIKFNISGTDDMIWAGNKVDSFCGSHGRGQDGRGDRDRFVVEWKTGKAWYPEEVEEEEDVNVVLTNGNDEVVVTDGNGHHEEAVTNGLDESVEDSKSSTAINVMSGLTSFILTVLVGGFIGMT